MAVSRPPDIEVTRILNAFQRDARAVFEQLLPGLRRRGLYPDALIDGWGDARGARGTASTVVLMTPNWLKPQHRTKQLARLRLEINEADEWTAIVTVVAQPDDRSAWPPALEREWWVEQRERIRGLILEYHAARP